MPLIAVPLLVSSSILLTSQAMAAPTANADNYTTTAGQSITVSPLNNDRADTGTSIYVEVVNSPSPWGTGTTTLNNNKVTYTPPVGFTGTTTFWYGIKDSRGLITSAPIKVTVNADGDGGTPQATPPPQAYGNAATTTSGQTITIDAIGNDTGDGLFITKVDTPAPYPSGSATIVNNKVRYTAPANFVGTSNFWYQIQDSSGRKTSNAITVTVNAATATSPYPTAGNDTAETTRDKPITIAPLWNDTGTELKITAVDGTTTQGSKTQIVGTNKILYTPSIWSKAGDTFWYVITDKFGRKNAAKVVVAVSTSTTSSGSYPTAGSDNYTVKKNSTGTVFNVFSNDTGSGLSFNQLYAYTQKGGRTYDNNGSVRYDAPSGFVGTDEFWYSMKDSIGRTNSAKVTITVEDTVDPIDPTEPNVAPDAVEDILRSTINASEFEIDVLANDTDENNDTLSVLSVGAARSGSVRLVNGRVLYTPPSFTASDTFRYTVSDGRGGTDSADATIGVIDPNNPTNNPTVSNEFITLAPGGTVVIRVLDNDSDPDGDTLILDVVTGGSQGTTEKVADGNGDLNWVRYTALPNASGTDEFFYGVADGLGGNGSGRVSITFQ
jgi:hypothetical protein